MIKCTIEALDQKPITPRTGKSKCKAETDSLPIEGGYQMFTYVEEGCESLGVALATDDIVREQDVYYFQDIKGRKFKMVVYG